jgi:hypothetical protein
MRERLRSHLSFANVTSLVALFVALGGTTYAATGGNFILGQQNSAGTPTRLSSATTDAAGTLKVANTASGGGRAIHATTNTGQGVYGYSSQNAGIVGESLNFDGVYGVSSSGTHAAVSAHNEVWKGFGLWAAGGSAANNTAAVHGQSGAGNAVEGMASSNQGSGVYGVNTATGGTGVAGRSHNGTAVMGDSANGWAMQAFGNATQSRGRGGFVKAMAFVDPDAHPEDPVRQCFNSQRAANLATYGNCGITFTQITKGQYTLDFGFQVSDRFASVSTGLFPDHIVTVDSVATAPPGTLTNNQFLVRIVSYNTNDVESGNFYIIVY